MVNVSIRILSLLVQKLVAGVPFMVVVSLDPLVLLVRSVSYIAVGVIHNNLVFTVPLNILGRPEVHRLLHRV